MVKRHSVVLLNGPPGAGKDTLGNALKVNFDARLLKFSEPLKYAVLAMMNIRDMHPEDMEDIKDEPLEALLGFSYRELQIWLSESCMKKKFGKDVFGKLLARRVQSSTSAPFTAITDSGFESEAETLIDELGYKQVYLIRVHRTEHDFSNDSRGYLECPRLPREQVVDFHNDFPLALSKRMICHIIANQLQLADPVTDILNKPLSEQEFKRWLDSQ